MDIKQIIAQHGQSVALAFSDVGLKPDLTAKGVMLAISLKGNAFIDAVSDRIDSEGEYAGFSGEPFDIGAVFGAAGGVYVPPQVYKTLTTIKKKSDKGQKVKNTLTDIFGALASVAGTYKGAKQKASGAHAASGSGGASSGGYADDLPPEEKQKKKSKIILIAAVLLVLILAVAVILKKK